VVVGELVIIEAEEVKNGAVDVADVVDTVDGFGADVVGRTDGVPGFGAASSEPHRHRFGIVVAAVADSAAHSVVGSAAKFAAPYDEGIVEHAAFFEILEKGGDGFVDRADEGTVGALDVVVAVPVSGISLHKADPFFDETSGEEAFAAKGISVLLAHAIGFEGGFFFAFEIEDFGDLHLHAIGEFVGSHAGAEFAAVRVGFEMALVEFCEEIEVLALSGAGDSGGGIEVEDGAAFRAEWGALEVGGEETVGPISGSALGVSGAGEDDEAGEVFVFGAESVSDP